MSAVWYQCAEGFLQAALKMETESITQKLRDGETPAKKLCKDSTSSGSKTSKTKE